MSGKGKEAAQRFLAIIVIIAMLVLMGIPPTVVVFFAVVVYFVWRAVDRAERHDIRRIFDFYISANEILRDDERRWYGFEIAEVVGRGESVLHAMPDAPPLLHFALGALYHRAGDNEAAANHLSFVLENEQGDERHRFAPSPELRRYVSILRRLEREPAEGPQTMAAIRSLDRMQRQCAATLLADSRERLHASASAPQLESKPAPPRAVEPNRDERIKTIAALMYEEASDKRETPHANVSLFEPKEKSATEEKNAAANAQTAVNNQSTERPFPTPPPSITEVLRDVYDEEKKTA